MDHAESAVGEFHADDFKRHPVLVVAKKQERFIGPFGWCCWADEVQAGMGDDVPDLGSGQPVLACRGRPGEPRVLHKTYCVGRN